MTIGKFGHDAATGPNPDFIELMKCHQAICSQFEREPSDVNVSMGMSDDFEHAVSINMS
jgi:PLP dependent protein